MVTKVPCEEVSVIESIPALETVRPLWKQHQRHPFADHDFFSLICSVRESRTRPCVFVLHRNGLPVTLLLARIDVDKKPLRIGYARLFTIALQELRVIDGGLLGQVDDAAIAALALAIQRFMRERRIYTAVFESIQDGTPMSALSASLTSFRRPAPAIESKYWRLTLPDSWDLFLKSRQAKHRYWLNRLARVLDKDFPDQWHIEACTSSADADRFVDAAEAIASKAYHRALNVGFCKNSEYVARVALEARRGMLRGYVLYIDGVPRAFWYCVVYQDTLHLLATGYDAQYRAYELGTVLLMRVLKDHCDAGIRRVDFGLGDAGYKQRFGSEMAVVRPVQLFSDALQGHALRCLLGAFGIANRLGRRLVERFKLTQQLKTVWKQHLSARASTLHF